MENQSQSGDTSQIAGANPNEPAGLSGPADLAEFYEHAYTQHTPAEGERYARWRALGAVGKADHVLALCARAGIWAGEQPINTLEIGCGDGALLSELHARGFGGRLAGVEITAAAVAIARGRAEIESVQVYDGLHLPAGDGAYDLGILSHVLEHVPDPAALLAEVARACRAVVFEVPLEANVSARRAGKREHAEEVGHLQRLDRDAARGIVSRAGQLMRASRPMSSSAEPAGAGALRIAAELEDPLPRAVHVFFASTPRARALGTAKWALRAGLHGAAPGLARRLFTVHYACLCVPGAVAVSDDFLTTAPTAAAPREPG